uniref:Uncharacterized protein n=1 Tax=Arundo donax TaxID=35708 RepID=A0A0A9C4R3_ARUDO
MAPYLRHDQGRHERAL